MNDILEHALNQVPSLVVLVLVVWIFLKHLKERDAAYYAEMAKINSEGLEARLETRKVIEHNTAVIEKNTETRGELLQAIREMRTT